MNDITVNPEVLLGLLTEVGRHRALADHETDIVEAIVCRGHKATGMRIRWTRQLDAELMKAANTRGGIRTFADKHNLSRGGVYVRLRRLRNVKLRKDGKKGIVGE